MSFEHPGDNNDSLFDYQRKANRWNKRMGDYWNFFNPFGTMRICKYCKCNDDSKPLEVYWVTDEECSECVNAAIIKIKPIDGTNQEDDKTKTS